MLGILGMTQNTAALPPATNQATITSDEMEVVNNGDQTIFRGHVVLTQAPYGMTSDQMVRYKDTGVVEAEGHVIGTWVKPTGEKLVAQGKKARYNPNDQTTELWSEAKLSRWETVRDTAPVVVTADRFIAHNDQRTLFARDHVHIQQGTDFSTYSDAAKYVDKDQAIYLWSKKKTVVDWRDAQGSGHFLSDRAVLYMSPRRVRLEEDVKGHVIPHTL
jgi:lipopolysaccharide transport protein LptA